MIVETWTAVATGSVAAEVAGEYGVVAVLSRNDDCNTGFGVLAAAKGSILEISCG